MLFGWRVNVCIELNSHISGISAGILENSEDQHNIIREIMCTVRDHSGLKFNFLHLFIDILGG